MHIICMWCLVLYTVLVGYSILLCFAVSAVLGIASNIESTSLLCWPSGADARHRRQMSSQVCSLYKCESGWSKRMLDIHTIPFELPIHPTAMAHGMSSLLPTSVKIWCSLIGAERPSTRGKDTSKCMRHRKMVSFPTSPI